MPPASMPDHGQEPLFRSIPRKLPLILLGLVPPVFLALAIVGAVRWFSPVPFWDMWDATISPYIWLKNGDWAQYWFQETNEHRIVFSKILFWIDYKFFGAESRFLIPANITLLILDWLAVCAVARRFFRERADLWLILCCGLAAPCMSWIQEPNITWGFQSQFFAAYLLPLLAFACLGRATQDKSLQDGRPAAWFLAALILGLSSMGTMANGVFVPPLMIVMLIVMGRRPLWPVVAVAVPAAICTALWFHHYIFWPRAHPTPGQFVIFVLTFLSGPFLRALGSNIVGYILSLIFIASAAGFTLKVLRQRRTIDPMMAALVTFLAYIGVTCAAIGYGRAAMTTDASLVTRYSTPMAMGWSVLAVLSAAALKERPFARKLFLGAGLAVALLLLPEQWGVFRDSGKLSAERKDLGGLALLMQVPDVDAIGNIYPVDTPANIAHIKETAGATRENHLSIFADPEIVTALSRIGKSSDTGFHVCRADLNGIAPINDGGGFQRVSGWVYDATKRNRIPRFVYFAEGGTIVGIAVTGTPRPDVAKIYHAGARYSGFDGYVTRGVKNSLSILCDG